MTDPGTTSTTRPTTSPSQSKSKSSRWPVYVGIVVVLVFIAAMAMQYLQTRTARAEAATLRRELAVARTEATLGAAALEAQRGGYENARRLASEFFTNLQVSAPQAAVDIRPTLETILDQRDATITMLSRGDPQAAAVLSRMFTEYRAALHGPGQ